MAPRMELPNLPSEVLAQILTDLPIHTLMQAVAGNRFFTFEVLKQIPRLLITRTHFDMDAPTIRKVLDVHHIEEVRIHCLIKGDPLTDEPQEYCVNASNKVVPLLCLFPNLKLVELGIMEEDERITNCREYYHGLLWALSGAFASRSLSKDLTFRSPLGIFCLWGDDTIDEESSCIFCNSVLSNFPIENILDINSYDICLDEKVIFNGITRRLHSPQSLQVVWKRLLINFCEDEYDGCIALDYALHTAQHMKRFLEREYLPDFSSNDFLCEAIANALNRARGVSITDRAFRILTKIGYPIEWTSYPLCYVPVDDEYKTQLWLVDTKSHIYRWSNFSL